MANWLATSFATILLIVAGQTEIHAQTSPDGGAQSQPLPLKPSTPTLPSAQVGPSLSAGKRAEILTDLKAKWQAAANSRPGGGARWATLLATAVNSADASSVLSATTARSIDELHKALAGGDITRGPETTAAPKQALGNGVTPQGVLGQSYSADLVYTPLPNGRCRIYNTRTLGTPLVGTRYLAIEDMANYAGQGGNGTIANGTGSTNCGIPLYNGAYALSVILNSPTGDGGAKIFEYGKPPASGNTVWANSGSSGVGADVTVKSCIGCAAEIGVNSATAVHVTVDVIGYYRYAQLPATPQPYCYATAVNTTSIPAYGTGDAYPPACGSGYLAETNCFTGHYVTGLSLVQRGRCSAGSTANYATSVSAQNLCCSIAGR